MKRKIISVICTAVLCITLISACSQTGKDEDVAEPYAFMNAGFEAGDLTGWTATGKAFTERCVEFNTRDGNGILFSQEGNFFLYGYKAGANAVGSLKSDSFKIKGNGKIGFLIGAGSDASKCYVSVCDENEKELLKRGNTDFDASAGNTMHRVIIDAKAHVGKTVFIKIVDNDSGSDGFNYINADDFIINFNGKEDKVGKVYDAQRYVEENMAKVNKKYRLNYHAMPPVGWMNDPNGFSYAFDKYHLFYQFNPYAAQWGPMHWGHYTSSDLVKWEMQPVALAPDKVYDNQYGCFSGSALEKDGKMYLFYTAVANDKQTQAVAVSTDGIEFEKYSQNPVIDTSKLPSGANANDFRDPKVFEHGGMYYMIVGSKATNGNGQLLLYKSSNLYSWSYVGVLISDTKTPGGIYECPDFVTIDGQDILIASPQFYATQDWRYENVHSVVYMPGSLNYQNGSYTYTNAEEIDNGFDFYAAQVMTNPEGRKIMTAWMQMWDRTMPTAADGWAGAMILPRELTLRGGKLYQAPVKEIENYRSETITQNNVALSGVKSFAGVSGNSLELDVEFDLGTASKVGVSLFKGGDNEVKVYYDKQSGKVVFDRSETGTRISCAAKEKNASIRSSMPTIRDNKLRLRFFVDVSSLEVFINDGEKTMTGNVYTAAQNTGIEFFAEGGSAAILSLKKYTLSV